MMKIVDEPVSKASRCSLGGVPMSTATLAYEPLIMTGKSSTVAEAVAVIARSPVILATIVGELFDCE
jgi:hypothetical protein